METIVNGKQCFEAGPNRIIPFGEGYARFLKTRGIDYGEQYSQLSRDEQIALVNEFNTLSEEAASRASEGANYG